MIILIIFCQHPQRLLKAATQNHGRIVHNRREIVKREFEIREELGWLSRQRRMVEALHRQLEQWRRETVLAWSRSPGSVKLAREAHSQAATEGHFWHMGWEQGEQHGRIPQVMRPRFGESSGWQKALGGKGHGQPPKESRSTEFETGSR